MSTAEQKGDFISIEAQQRTATQIIRLSQRVRELERMQLHAKALVDVCFADYKDVAQFERDLTAAANALHAKIKE